MEKNLMILCSVFFIVILIQAFFIYKINKELKWFEDWGREYLDKHRDQAKKEGLCKDTPNE